MATPDEELQLKIEILRKSFVAGVAGRLSELDGALARIQNATALAEQADDVRTILEQAHKIAGSAGTFGYGDMSIIASEIERFCDDILKNQYESDADARAKLVERISALHVAAP